MAGTDTAQYLESQIQALHQGDTFALSVIYSRLYPKPKNLFQRLSRAHTKDRLLQAAADAIVDYMSGLSQRALISLHEVFPQCTSMGWYEDWSKTSASEMAAQFSDPDTRFYILALGTFHPNGYFRQRCLRELEQYGGRALPYTFLLVNNWVKAIREDATAISLRLLEKATPGEILNNLTYLERITLGLRRSEDSQGSICSLIQKRLSNENTPSTEQILSLECNARRICYGLLLNEISEQEKCALLTREPDSYSRLLVAKQLLSGQPSESMWRLLLHSKSAPIRYLALQTKFHRQDVWDGIEEFLFDSDHTIREYISFLLHKQNIPVAELYRTRILNDPCIGAVLGLGESGTAEDLALIRPFTDSQQLAFRRAALTATANLTATECGDLLYEHLGYEWSSKTAYRLIIRGKYRYPAQQCYQSYCACDDDVLRHRYFRLLLQCGNWDILPWLIRLYLSLPDTAKETANYHLHRWQVGFLTPSAEQKGLITEAIATAQLPPKLMRLLEFSLDSSGYF